MSYFILFLSRLIPIGLEIATTSDLESKIFIGKDTVSVRKVIDKIIDQKPEYKWSLIDGVVNFTPERDRDSVIADLLATKISRFTVRGQSTLLTLRYDKVRLIAGSRNQQEAGTSRP